MKVRSVISTQVSNLLLTLRTPKLERRIHLLERRRSSLITIFPRSYILRRRRRKFFECWYGRHLVRRPRILIERIAIIVQQGADNILPRRGWQGEALLGHVV